MHRLFPRLYGYNRLQINSNYSGNNKDFRSMVKSNRSTHSSRDEEEYRNNSAMRTLFSNMSSADSANKIAKKQLKNIIKPEIHKMIKKSGITGIKMPAGSIKNYLHEYKVLTAFKDALPNAINFLKKNNFIDINAHDIYGNTPLHRAIQQGEKEIAQVLIDARANVNAQDKRGWTPLHRAIQEGEKEIAKVLIDANSNVNAQDKRGRTPLHGAAKEGHTDIVKALIGAWANMNAQDKRGWTPLHLVAKKGNTELAKALITVVANVNARTHLGNTPLHWAAKEGHTELSKALIYAGAYVNAKDKFGITPLHWAETTGQTEVAKILRTAQITQSE